MYSFDFHVKEYNVYCVSEKNVLCTIYAFVLFLLCVSLSVGCYLQNHLKLLSFYFFFKA